MNSTMEFRLAEKRDAEPLANLVSELGYPSNTASISDRLDLILRDPGHCVFVAVDNRMVVGWVHASRTFRIESDPFVEIGGLVVFESLRREGVG